MSVHPNSIHEMIRWMQTQPEVIKYLRDNYEDESLPSWVGKLEAEEPPPPTMDPSTTTSTTVEQPMEANQDDVVDGTSIQPPIVEGVQKVVVGGGTGGGQVVVNGGQVVVSGGNSGGGTGGGSPEKEAPPRKKEAPPPKQKVPDPLVPTSAPPPPKKELKQGITEELSPAKKELIELIQQMQYHDPDVIPMDGGGYGKVRRDGNGTIVGIPLGDLCDTRLPTSMSFLQGLIRGMHAMIYSSYIMVRNK